MTKFVTAPPGTNPMEQPEQYKRKRASRLTLVLVICGSILALLAVCGLPLYFMSKPKAQAAAIIPTETSTSTATVTTTSTATATTMPTEGVIAPLDMIPTWSGPTATSTATSTPWVITQVVTKIVPGNSYPVPVVTVQVVKVEIPVQQTVIVTTTPEATQTPWIIEVTRIVEVTPTPTETPTETPTPTLEGYPAAGE